MGGAGAEDGDSAAQLQAACLPAAMERALEVAVRGRGSVAPNPVVGAVAVRDGEIVGEGWHARYGGPHAERDLIARLTERGGPDACRGADLYVTLEPCAHHGKTPPCTDAVIEAGFARVFVGCDDPNPETSGQGYARLAAAGIPVLRDVAGEAARAVVADYLCLRRTGRALATAKWAMTADGRIASAEGDSRWISSEATRELTRRERGGQDAILVGRGTVEADDPLLTARTDGTIDPVRVVLDSRFRLPPESRLVRTAGETPLVVIGSAGGGEPGPDEEARRRTLEARGVITLRVEAGSDRRPRPSALLTALGALRIDDPTIGVRGIAHVLVEGGAEVHGSFLADGCIDRARIIVAPRIIGGREAPGPIGGTGIPRMADALSLRDPRWRAVGEDLLLEAALGPLGVGESP
jgi:diaminohydroxyphosphoribosylaminopyrimidine deaminase/5-amino-6-(5-phosphoribosylamino)uracil reductase